MGSLGKYHLCKICSVYCRVIDGKCSDCGVDVDGNT